VRSDGEGVELRDHRAAQAEAIKTLGQLLMDEPDHVLRDQGMKLIVTDEAGLILFVLDVSAVTAPALSQSVRLA
jgi:hypothetical protein